MKHLHEFRILICLSLLLIFMSTCQKSDHECFSQFYDIGSEGLLADSEFLYQPKVSDGIYDILLVVRYTNKLDLESIPIKIEYFSGELNEIQYKSETINFSSQEDNIKKGNFGVYQLEMPLLNDIKVEDGFYVTISPSISVDCGVISLGIIYKSS